MTAIFISHSSADNAAAAELKRWLEQEGHTSLFLDFDPEAGIRGGTGWEQTLYQNLRQCQAVIALLTPNWLASKWCFAELVQARERGKAIFPLKLQPCESGGVFGDIQHIDLTENPAEGYRRLRTALLERGLDPSDAFDWDPRRPPFPGLLAFQEPDAAIFFGRGDEILKTLETLDALRRHGGDAACFLLLLGASGSGKSSLARAGVIPRLNKKPAEWLPVPPFRPQLEPLDELAMALATAFEARGRPREWGALQAELHQAAQSPAGAQILLKILRDLAIAAKQPEATVLLTLDQAEELFGYAPAESTTRFLRLLRAGIEFGGRRLMALATLRSDFLGDFQNHPVLQDTEYPHHLRYRAVPVDPMPLRSFPEIILGPARRAGLQLDDGLVETLVSDTGTRDALPLLAFTLRRLYERFGGDGRLTLDEYATLGRLEGAIREEAERIIAEAAPAPEDLDALHAAFVPTLVRINAEGGFARRRALLEELPGRAVPLIRRFVDARLLVVDRDADGSEVIEVTHEALLRTWPQLSDWLKEDRENLRLLEGLQRAATDWEQGGRRDDLLVHHGARLSDAEAMLASPGFVLPDSAVERAYLKVCRATQDARTAAERDERERRVRDAERIAEEQQKAAAAQRKIAEKQRAIVVGTGFSLAIVVILAGLAGWKWWDAKREATLAVARQLAAQAMVDMDLRAPHNLLLGLKSISLTREAGAFSAIGAMQLLNDELRTTGGVPLRHPGPVVDLEFSSDDRWLATASADAVRLWNRRDPGAAPQVLPAEVGAINALDFSSDGRFLAAVGSAAGVRLWEVSDSGTKGSRILPASTGHLVDVAFSDDGRWLAAASTDPAVYVWDLASTDPAASVRVLRHRDKVQTLAFSRDSRLLATGSADGTVSVWDPAAQSSVETPLRESTVDLNLRKVAFSPDGQWLAAGGSAQTGRMFVALVPAQTMDRTIELEIQQWSAGTLAFSPDGHWLATPSAYDARLWDLEQTEPLAKPIILPGHKSETQDIAFSVGGRWMVTGNVDFTARLWNMEDRNVPPIILRGHEGPIVRAAFSHDDRHLATASNDNTVRLWSISSPSAQPLALLTQQGSTRLHLWGMKSGSLPEAPQTLGEDLNDFGGAVFSQDGRWLAALPSVGAHVVHLWDLAAPSPTHYVIDHGYGPWTAPAFSPDGRWLATGGVDAAIKLWDLQGTAPDRNPKILQGHGAPIQSLAFSGDGHRLVSGAMDGYAMVWDLTAADPSTQPQRLRGGSVKAVAISPDGRYVVAGSIEPDFAARVWDLSVPESASNPVTLQFKNRVFEVAISPDGRWAAAGSWDQTTQVLDLKASGGKPLVLKGHAGWTLTVAFSPDSKWLATGNNDRTARLWHLDAADPSADSLVLNAPSKVGSVAFSRDGRWLALSKTEFRSSPFSPDGSRFASSNTETYLYHPQLDDLVALACRTAGRDFADGESGDSPAKVCPEFAAAPGPESGRSR